MDTTEDLSARVLLRNILITEPPRTPVTRSTQAQSANETQRVTRSTRRSAGSQTPQDILRRSLRTKMRESISRKSLPPPTRRTGSAVLRRTNTPAPPSVLFDEGDTPRHILMNILRTEPVKSPVVHETVVPQEPQPPASTNSSIVGTSLTSVDGSRLDLSDITFGHAISTAKGLRRKRPRRSLNVTDFEKRLKDGDDNGVEESLDDHSSLSLLSSSSLSLKTPFVDVRTEKRGLQRRVSNRRKITEADFGAAVNKRQTGVVSGLEAVRQNPNTTTFLEGFTLGQSKLGELEITSDIINSNTALYAQPESTASNFSTVPRQDKSTEQFDDDVEEAASESKEASGAAESTDDEAAPQSQDEEDEVAETQSSDAVKSEEGGSNVESHTEEEAATASQSEEEEEVTAPSQSEEEEATAPSQSEEEEAAAASQSEEEEATAPSQSEEEEAAAASQSDEEEAATASQSEEEEAATASQSEEEEAAAASQSEEEEAATASQSEEEEAAAASQSEEEEAASQSEEEEVTAESKAEGSVVSQSDIEEIDEEANGTIPSQTEDENVGRSEEEDDEREPKHLVRDDEHISRRSRRSEGGLIMPVTETDGDLPDDKEAGWLEGLEKGAGESSPPGMRIPDSESGEGEPDFDKENSFRLEMTYDIQDSSRKSNDPPTGAAAAEPTKQEEDSEEDDEDSEDSEEIPMKTPAFVKEKRNLLRELNSPSTFKGHPCSNTSAGLPPTKPKQVRKRKAGPTKKAAGLPKSYLMGAFKHFAKTKVSADVYPVLSEIMDKFFERMAEDLETYAVHAKRKTIEIEDAVLLLKRQGYVNDKMPVEVLIEKFLRMDQRKLLIPVATSGNVVVPKSKR